MWILSQQDFSMNSFKAYAKAWKISNQIPQVVSPRTNELMSLRTWLSMRPIIDKAKVVDTLVWT